MAGTSLVAPHPTIANMWPMVTDSLNANLILLAKCTGAPDTTADTYSHGCMMIRTDSGTGVKAIYENTGSSASPSWNLLGDITAGEITLAEGNVLVGNSSGVATALNAKTDTRILVGNGTTITSVPLGTDVTMANTGAVTIANNAVTAVKINADAVTTAKILNANVTGAKLVTGAVYGSVAKKTSGVTPVNIFGTTNGFAGSLTAVQFISDDDTAGNITLATNAGTVATFAKGSTGAVTGSAIAVTAFTSGGTMTVVSDGASANGTIVATFTVA